MIRRDRELLARLANLNQAIAHVVLIMLEHQDAGELNPAHLRLVGDQLYRLGRDLLDRANEVDPG
ncbi:hypothetical protein [Gandjariella thermophila]|uniref:Uncharacterized protein n=1 Tax=Gandjariella thermophila TaxID=1931992 RepID=A0A4D4JIH4_9PSEU|nr:hypothetical protein [Gandjariella thermophila]GDY33693.1 hypothetical protein GTS_53260 [Gandjariella thermophila]